MTSKTRASGLFARGGGVLVLGAAVFLEIAYILLFSPFVTNDMATHIGSSAAFVDSLAGFELGSRFLEWNPWPAPNLLAHLFLSVLIAAAGVESAEIIVLVVYVIALPFAALYAVRSTQEGSEWLAFFVLPLTFSFAFLYGFVNFSYSVVVFLVVAGFVLRTDARMTTRRSVALAALLVLAFFSHFVGYLAACLFVLAVIGVRAACLASRRRTILVHGAIALLPAAVLALIFVVSSESASDISWSGPTRRVAGMVTLTWGTVSYDRLEIIFCLVAAAALWVLIARSALARRPWRERDPDTIALAVFTLSAALVTVAAPDAVGSGGSYLSERLVLFPVLGVLIWLSRQSLRTVHFVTGAAVAVVAAAGLALVRYDELREIERIADDLAVTIPCVGRQATMVQGNLADVRVGSAGRIDALTAEEDGSPLLPRV